MATFFAAAHAYVALSRARSLQGLFILNYRREAFLVDPYYVQLWNWFVATNVLAPKPAQHIPPYPRRTFTSTLVAGIMCVSRSWHTKSHFPQNLDARILKVNMLLILQYVSFPWWSYIDRQLQGDRLSLDIDDLNEDGTEQPRTRGRPHGTSQQPNVGVQLLDGNNKPHVFSADVLGQMSVVELRTLCAAHGLSTCGTKATFRERILRKQDHIEGPPKQYPTKSHVSPPPSSMGDHPHLDARICHFSFEYWPDEKNDSIEHNVHLAECAWLSTSAVQCLLEVLLPPGTTSVKPVIIDMQLAQLMRHFPTLSLICTQKCALPLWLTSRNSTIGVHYVSVTDVQVDCKSLVVHDSKDASSECGALFRVMLKKIGWSFLWHHYGTQPDSDTCGFRVVMLAMQWCTAKTLTGQLPRWFLAYCASILQMFALDSTTLRSIVHTFQDATYEDALTMYDEPVIWAMTECGALPDITDAELDAETSEHHWTCPPQATNRGPSHPTVGNNEAHPYPSQTRQAQRSKKSESKGGASRKATPNTPQKPTRPSQPTPTAKPSRRVPKSKRTTMPAQHQPPSQAPYRSQPHPPQGGRGEDNPSSRKRTSQQNNGPHSKRQRATGNEQRGGRKRPQPHQDPTAPSGEPPRSRPRAERTPVHHLALTKREITEWSTRIIDENTSLRRRKAHALHFLGAQDATAVKGQYRALSLLLHPDKNRTDPMATERFKVLGAAKDLFD